MGSTPQPAVPKVLPGPSGAQILENKAARQRSPNPDSLFAAARAIDCREDRARPSLLFDALVPVSHHRLYIRNSHVMNSLSKAVNSRDIRLLESILLGTRAPLRSKPTPQWRSPKQFIARCMQRGAKTTTRKRIKDIQQGAILAEPLSEFEDEQTSQQPQYPPVLQGVRENMIKFPNCVVITRVGNFYEVGTAPVHKCFPC